MIGRLLKALQNIEWIWVDDISLDRYVQRCPACAALRDEGHRAWCSTNNAIAETKQSDGRVEMYDALKVITLDPKITRWLGENDPQALEQACKALDIAEGKCVNGPK